MIFHTFWYQKMPCCAAINCSNSKGSLYRFPSGNRNKHRLERWLRNVARENFNHENAKLCVKHFNEDQFENHRADGKRKLKPNAIPTIFSYRLQDKKRKPPVKRRSPSLSLAEVNNIQSLKQTGTDHTYEMQPYSTVQDLKNERIDFHNESHDSTVQDLKNEGIEFHNESHDDKTWNQDSDELREMLEIHSTVQDFKTQSIDQDNTELRIILEMQKKKIQELELKITTQEEIINNLLNKDGLKILQRKELSGFFIVAK